MPFAFLINQPSNQPSNQQFSGKYKDSDFQNYSIVDLAYGSWATGGVILNDGESDHLYMWGSNYDGQLANNEISHGPSGFSSMPQEVDLNFDGDNNLETTKGTITNLEIGKTTAGAVVNDGEYDHLYMWGSNDKGQLGIGQIGGSNSWFDTPQKITMGLTKGIITQFALDGSSSAVVINDGKSDHLYMWGDNDNSKLGLGISVGGNQSSPTELNLNFDEDDNTSETVVDIDLSRSTSGAIINTDGTDNLYMWGGNENYQLGNKDFTSGEEKIEPWKVEQIPSGTMSNLSINDRTAGVVIDDNLYMWGSNSFGGVGNGLYGKEEKEPIKIDFAIEGKVTDLILSADSSSAIINDGKNDHLYLWGNKHSSEDKDHYATPTEKDLNFDEDNNPETIQGTIVQVGIGNGASGNTHKSENFAVVVNDGKNDHLYTWGTDLYGANGNGIGTKNNYTSVVEPTEITSDISSSSIETEVIDENTVKIDWNLEQNSATTLISLTLYTNGFGSADGINLLNGNSWGAGSIIVENLEYLADYEDWQIGYKTNFGSGLMTIDEFSGGVERVKGDITINKPTFHQNTDDINIDAIFNINIAELKGTTKLTDSIAISGDEIEDQTINLNEDNISFTVEDLVYNNPYKLIVEYGLVTDTNLIPILKTIELATFFTPPEKSTGDIVLLEPTNISMETTAKFIIDIDGLTGTTKLKKDIVISGDKIITQQIEINESDMSFFVVDLKYGVNYNLTLEYTLSTDTDKNGQLKTMKIDTFFLKNSWAPDTPNSKIDFLTYEEIEISWEIDEAVFDYTIIIYDSQNKMIEEYEYFTGNVLLISDLEYKSDYTIKIWSSNGMYDSSFASEINFTTPDKYPWVMYVNYSVLGLSILFIIIGALVLIYLMVNLKKSK